MHKTEHVQYMCFPGKWKPWVRWGYLTGRIILPLRKYGNFAVVEHTVFWQQTSQKCQNVIQSQHNPALKHERIISSDDSQPSVQTVSHDDRQHGTYHFSSLLWDAVHTSYFNVSQSHQVLKRYLNSPPLAHRHVSHPTTMLFSAQWTNTLRRTKMVSITAMINSAQYYSTFSCNSVQTKRGYWTVCRYNCTIFT